MERSSPTSTSPLRTLTAYWLRLERGWKALVLGLAIVVLSQLVV